MKILKVLLKQIRKNQNLTIVQLSVLSDVSESEISYIENYQRIPSLEVVCKLAKALNVQVTDIVDCQNNKKGEK